MQVPRAFSSFDCNLLAAGLAGTNTAKFPLNNNQGDKPERKGGFDPSTKIRKGSCRDGEREAREQPTACPLIISAHTHCNGSESEEAFRWVQKPLDGERLRKEHKPANFRKQSLIAANPALLPIKRQRVSGKEHPDTINQCNSIKTSRHRDPTKIEYKAVFVLNPRKYCRAMAACSCNHKQKYHGKVRYSGIDS